MKDSPAKESEPPITKMDPAEIAAMSENDFEPELEEKVSNETIANLVVKHSIVCHFLVSSYLYLCICL